VRVSRRFSTVVAACVVVVSACSGDGTSLREPGTGGATPRPEVVVTEPEDLFSDIDISFVLRSPAFEASGSLPAHYTRRDGADVSPPLDWINQSTDAVELALVVTDPSADGFVHWVIWGLDPTSTGLAEGQIPSGAMEALNGFGDVGYVGPDPPQGDAPHVYLFRLFALRDFPTDVEPGIDGRSAIPLLEAHAMAIAELISFYP
jgi:Raf kinase inhibitor-like YbhB/YbcL family protein